MNKVFLLLAASALSAALVSADDPVVSIPNLGDVRGSHLASVPNGKPFSAYYGIPYGQAHGGEKRFTQPVAAEAFDGEYDATEATYFTDFTSKICGPTSGGDTVYTAEDCLNLGVFVPEEPVREEGEADDALLPVMVFIHGGSFTSGNYGVLKPHRYMDTQRVIQVAMNYRLGILGFLCTDDDSAAGNMGLLDQRLALKWVHDNIEAFGGDPQKVTVFGQSAGCVSTTYQLTNEASQGFFQRGIGQSGSTLVTWGLQTDPMGQLQIFAEAGGCPTTSTADSLECLRALSLEDLKAAESSFMSSQGGYGLGKIAPCNQVAGDIRMHNTPVEDLGSLNVVPTMMGTQRDEGQLFTQWMASSQMLPNSRQDEPNYLNDTFLRYNLEFINDPRATDDDYIQSVREEFFSQDGDFDSLLNAIPGLYAYVGASWIKEATLNFANAIGDDTFFYSMEFFDAEFGSWDDFLNLAPQGFLPGVSHSDSLTYEFLVKGYETMSPSVQAASDNFVNTMVNFAVTGNPLGAGAEAPNPVSVDGTYVRITDVIEVKTDYRGTFPERDLFQG